MPVWLSAGTLLVMLTLFGLYSHRMNLATETVQQRIDAIGKNLPPPPVPVHKLRLKILLANEIARGLLTVEEDDHHSRVIFRGDTMFIPGQKTVNDALSPVIDKAAREIARVGGAVTVTGHTDSQPIHSAEFPSNRCCRKTGDGSGFTADVRWCSGQPDSGRRERRYRTGGR